MKFKNPDTKTLITCWLALVLLTIGTMTTGRITSEVALSNILIISLGFITWFKSMLILRYYLNLASASRGWNKVFNSYLFVILGIIMVIFLLT